MILGWARDHRCAMLLVALVAAFGLPVREVVLGNPLGSSLVSLDASAFLVFFTAAAAVNALRSRVARVLLVRSAWWARLLWLGALSVTTALVLVAADPRSGAVALVGHLSVLLWMPLALCAAAGEAVALTAVFALFVAHMVSPRLEPAPWWSPLLHGGERAPDLLVAGLLLSATCWLYVRNAGERLNS